MFQRIANYDFEEWLNQDESIIALLEISGLSYKEAVVLHSQGIKATRLFFQLNPHIHLSNWLGEILGLID